MNRFGQLFTTDSVRNGLFQRVDLSILVLLRVVTGVSLFFWARSYTQLVPFTLPDGTVQFVPLFKPIFQDPQFLFKYAGFEWVKLWPGNGIYWHFLVTKIAALMLAIGLFTRVSAAVLCGSVAYVLLVERQIYLNHYYLLACVAGLLVFLPSARSLSVDAAIGFERPGATCPRWQIWLVRFQLALPYVFGGIAKMELDWMRGLPASMILNDRKQFAFVDYFTQLPGHALIFSWGGLLFDLLIVPLLLYRRTRWLAVALAVGFHLSNAFLFKIGVFPWLMLATLIVFFPIDTFGNLLRCLFANYSDSPINYRQSKEIGLQNQSLLEGKLWLPQGAIGKCGVALAAIYVIVQLLLPVRPWIVPGTPSWNERGQRFAWRMMLRQKSSMAHFKLVAPDGTTRYYPSTIVMTEYQARRAERNPELLRQAAWQFKRNAEKVGVNDIKVYCLALVSLNGRKPIPIIDPGVDLLTVKRGWFYDDWVNQQVGPIPSETWGHPKDEWWQHVNMPDQFTYLTRGTPSELQKVIDVEIQTERANIQQ